MRRSTSILLALAAVLAVVDAARAQTVTEFSAGITAGSNPRGIVAGPDGNLWFTETATGRIGRITPAGVVTEFETGAGAAASISFITAGPDGNLWFTEFGTDRVSRITPSGEVTRFSTGITPGARPLDITPGPDGNLWFTESGGKRIGRITPAGVVTEFANGIPGNASPGYIVAGPDGNLWFTDFNGRIGRITTAGAITFFSDGVSLNPGLYGITAGPDGNLWFAELRGSRVGRITTDGVITEFSAGITPGGGVQFIRRGPDGNLWFTAIQPDRVGRLTTTGVVTEYTAGISDGATLGAIAAGPDGNLWFTEINGGRVAKITTGSANYEGLWWRSPAGSESGWGVNITHQGDILFATWFTYDTDGSGLWLVMPNGARAATGTYGGPLYRTTGPSFDAVPWNPAQVAVSQVGVATFSFTDAANGTFTYTVNGLTQSKPITRQVFAAPVPTCAAGGPTGATPNYQDLWWKAPAGSESGWGVNIAHQGDTLFVTWFTYDATGKGLWLVISNGAKTAPGVYSGALYRTTGPAFSASPWNPSLVAVSQAGSATLTFADANSGTFAYTVNGLSQAKAITRQAYSTPVTICR